MDSNILARIVHKACDDKNVIALSLAWSYLSREIFNGGAALI
jgi:hypothetical protein